MVKNKSLLMFLVAFILSAGFTNCGSEGTKAELKSEFSYAADNYLYSVNPIQFNDKSTISEGKITSWHWDFGDGETSDQQNPEHLFKSAGEFTVALTISDKQGNSNNTSKKIKILDKSIGLHRILNQQTDTVYVVAHRALHLSLSDIEVAENSMTAIKEAIKSKIDFIEVDVRRSSDGVLVLVHDATVDRTTNGKGTVNAMTFNDLKKLKLVTYKSKIVTTDTIPTLKQVLDVCKNNIYVVIDIDDSKSPVSENLAVVKEKNMINHVIFFTSSLSDISYLVANNAIVMPSCYNNTTFNSLLQAKLKPLIFQTDNNGIAEEWVSMKNSNVKIYTNNYLLTSKNPVNDNWSELETTVSNGGNMVQTDYPVEMLNYLKTKNKH